jgi:hypothetical protein
MGFISYIGSIASSVRKSKKQKNNRKYVGSDAISCSCDNGIITCPGCDGEKQSQFGVCAGCLGKGKVVCGKCGGKTYTETTHPIHAYTKEQNLKWIEEGKCQCCGAESGEYKGICDECRLS